MAVKKSNIVNVSFMAVLFLFTSLMSGCGFDTSINVENPEDKAFSDKEKTLLHDAFGFSVIGGRGMKACLETGPDPALYLQFRCDKLPADLQFEDIGYTEIAEKTLERKNMIFPPEWVILGESYDHVYMKMSNMIAISNDGDGNIHITAFSLPGGDGHGSYTESIYNYFK